MKKLLSPLILAMACSFMMSAKAQTSITDDFILSVTLNSACKLTSAPADFSITYNALQATDEFALSPFSVQCTNLLPYTMTFDNANADVLGLTIPLTVRNSGNTATVSGSQAGTGAVVNYNVRAFIAAGQAGTCATGTCGPTTVTRNLVISY